MKLAIAYEESGDNDSAKMVYQQIVDEYPSAQEVNNAKKFMAKLQ